MEVHHAPKMFHGWREFAKEYGIIVLGVLTALALDQAVESMHWSHRVHDSAEAMRLEMSEDNGPQGYLRIAAAPCFDAELDRIQAAVQSGADRNAVAALIEAYAPPMRTWDEDAWKAVLASGVGAHVSSQTLVDWSKPYRTIPALDAVNTQERADRTALQLTRTAPDELSPAEGDAVLAAVQRLRTDNHEMARLSRVQLFGLEKFGTPIAAEERRNIVQGLRARFGACVVEPSTAGVNPNDQLQGLGPQPKS